jgi:uncharacterized protein with PQ loop repeat
MSDSCNSCDPGTSTCIHWKYEYFGECIITAAQQAGFWLGLLSTIIWMIAQIPQVVLNFRTGRVVGVSSAFLVCLVVGDVSNLIGIIVMRGLTTQIITAAWYTLIDATAFLQWFYYHRRAGPESPTVPDPMRSISPLPLLVTAANAAGTGGPYELPFLWGSLLGWLSALLYLGSRVPQLWTNYERKKTDGLSPGYFIAALFGNITYGASIFLQDSSWKSLWKQFPWLVGSLGNLVFDTALISQFIYYGKRSKRAGDEAAQPLISQDTKSEIWNAQLSQASGQNDK